MGLPRSNDGKAGFLAYVEGLTSVIGHPELERHGPIEAWRSTGSPRPDNRPAWPAPSCDGRDHSMGALEQAQHILHGRSYGPVLNVLTV